MSEEKELKIGDKFIVGEGWAGCTVTDHGPMWTLWEKNSKGVAKQNFDIHQDFLHKKWRMTLEVVSDEGLYDWMDEVENERDKV